uniref:Reverse transcriptase Ty1/copia-type domain-containing protein n=1 Tax=Amphimedon queenslandica TaxID=400682 RepID=A0A1X7UEC3_AMPQE
MTEVKDELRSQFNVKVMGPVEYFLGVKLSKATDESTLFDSEKYQSAVGKLLASRTRPDTAFAVSNVAKYTSNPTEQHWKAVKHIFRYLAGTINYGLLYAREESLKCLGYSDSDWAGDLDV